MTNELALALLADGMALVYHEARHVRFLIDGGHLDGRGWESIRSLPINRVEAWRVVDGVRQKSRSAKSAAELAETFRSRFGRSVSDLEDLFANANWKHAAAAGGHAWRGVVAAVIALAGSLDGSDPEGIAAAASALVSARHNNGFVSDKVSELDAHIGASGAAAWSGGRLTPG
jgi:hypothetical protein